MNEIIVLKAEISEGVVTTNLPQFRAWTAKWLESINTELKTDEEFGQAEMDVKTLKGVEERITTVRDEALEKATALNDLLKGLADATGEVGAARLKLERQIAKRKEEVKSEIVASGLETIECSASLRAPTFLKSLQEAIKGKRTVATMKASVDQVAACHNAQIRQVKRLLDVHVVEHGTALVMDRNALEVRTLEFVEHELQRRVEAYKAEVERKKLEAEAERLRQEAAAEKRKRDAEAQAAAQARAADKVVPFNPAAQTAPTGATITTMRMVDGSGRVVYNPPATATAAPQVGTIPTGPESEWREMTAVVVAAFQMIKDRRQALEHDINKRRMESFGAACQLAFKEAQQIKS